MVVERDTRLYLKLPRKCFIKLWNVRSSFVRIIYTYYTYVSHYVNGYKLEWGRNSTITNSNFLKYLINNNITVNWI